MRSLLNSERVTEEGLTGPVRTLQTSVDERFLRSRDGCVVRRDTWTLMGDHLCRRMC